MAGDGPWLTWIGDDFTGSAAVMEVLAFAGLPSVLFTGLPDAALAQRFAGLRGVGIATTLRSQAPAEMRAALPPLVAWLEALGAGLLHYKICSTFDSAPEMGSIGCAAEVLLEARAARAALMLTAAPVMRRYQVFGHLFAGMAEGVFRLDRHPVMARHPVTPMAEADLLRHLAGQTNLPGGLISLEHLAGDGQARLAALVAGGARVLSVDSMDAVTEAAAGRLIWQNRGEMPVVLGSQGVEYALVRHWRETGLIGPAPEVGSAGAVAQIAAVSGSVSPVTAGQLGWAGAHGFARIGFDAAAVCGPEDGLAAEEARVVDLALRAASAGMSPLVHSAAGPDDPGVARFRAALSGCGLEAGAANRRIGAALGRVLDRVLAATGLRRAVISGGDTSGHGMEALGLQALVALAPTVPGAALCRAHGAVQHDGLEIALKGGQMGTEDYFGWIRAGGGPRPAA
ncbi:four-carbon acid sugar kinase family protein [Paragemmobacter ruber]|uniref:Four-carbon acid sugar kinase family protein n=1 Tax=Paragemmobacter ruber TaxID=1985673 RepID=A0ABW9YAJ2_9RHOB|nr:four-carbon acid sugar kinase family protein [Rhodobacter ruber]NBE09564.1 four-carbon acid sugar kinase family protein [Rhodobacter ruber]